MFWYITSWTLKVNLILNLPINIWLLILFSDIWFLRNISVRAVALLGTDPASGQQPPGDQNELPGLYISSCIIV